MKFKVLGAVASAAVLSLVFTGTASAVNGTASYYNDAGYGACGTRINAATELLVAAPAALWTTPNPNNDPLCRKSIRVTHKGRTITVRIKDKCPSCASNKIDLSQPAFSRLADTSLGIISVTWQIV
ncbi:Rare lipoprotein A (RlpA)-like double-psi beta-barrel [Lentzea albidocapillata subsp. violacea]|uniref:Rare lipoprotein A (RlpA)-like double-psi beta-barrel n=1 Tax=Lentzea albidocapillata subsp. violacea TaxID=128104 RepID=A0A1G9PBQ5_9PSEU|nr:cysteine/serine endopeptidase inhibitor [Lentzea albidocapillata]SDL96200.1 Rare lipoprotein A (RlpA)-like double-psi beta-barrel [Lentzea albidocapillata subsp. violacea]